MHLHKEHLNLEFRHMCTDDLTAVYYTISGINIPPYTKTCSLKYYQSTHVQTDGLTSY